MADATIQLNSTDAGIVGLLMELQKSVSEMSGDLRRLDERIERSLATIPRIDTIEERLTRIETIAATLKEENDKRISRIWAAVQGVAAAIAALLVISLWAFDHFRMK